MRCKLPCVVLLGITFWTVPAGGADPKQNEIDRLRKELAEKLKEITQLKTAIDRVEKQLADERKDDVNEQRTLKQAAEAARRAEEAARRDALDALQLARRAEVEARLRADSIAAKAQADSQKTEAIYRQVLATAEANLRRAEAEARKAKEAAEKPSLAPYTHAVIFYLKKDAPAGTAEKLIADCHAMLGKIPSVRGLNAGKPADKATPEVSVTGYDVGLLVLFDNYEGLQKYIDDPLHTDFVKKYGPHIEKVLVYDFLRVK